MYICMQSIFVQYVCWNLFKLECFMIVELNCNLLKNICCFMVVSCAQNLFHAVALSVAVYAPQAYNASNNTSIWNRVWPCKTGHMAFPGRRFLHFDCYSTKRRKVCQEMKLKSLINKKNNSIYCLILPCMWWPHESVDNNF